MSKAEVAGEPFVWLTATNRGASEVCEAALELAGITKLMLETGYFCDPTSKSSLRIVAKPGVYIRLCRNFDKKRGFVNGAIGIVVESLDGNAVFVVRLIGTGNLVLVHPMREHGETFLPCCYGYATTIRRAQGADLHHGCIYMDQLKRVAARGYAYVACSRFKVKLGVICMDTFVSVISFLWVCHRKVKSLSEVWNLSCQTKSAPGVPRSSAHSNVVPTTSKTRFP